MRRVRSSRKSQNSYRTFGLISGIGNKITVLDGYTDPNNRLRRVVMPDGSIQGIPENEIVTEKEYEHGLRNINAPRKSYEIIRFKKGNSFYGGKEIKIPSDKYSDSMRISRKYKGKDFIHVGTETVPIQVKP
jgi:hypothetical protein